VLRKTTGTGLVSQTARTFVASWLERTRGEVSASTRTKYEQTARLWLESLSGKADLDMTTIRQNDIARFRDEQARRVSTGTANGMLKIVRVLLGAAEADGIVQRNEARFVKRLKVVGEENARRPFTLPELQRILEACDAEWRALVMFGFYTGARLGDLAALTWQNLDLERNNRTPHLPDFSLPPM
jgi:integrase